MKIFFTASYYGKKTHQEVYDVVVNNIKNHGGEVLSLETQSYEDLVPKELRNRLSKDKIHYIYTKKAIELCDAAIIEISINSFKLGHESTLLLSKNKDVLLLKDSPIYNLDLTYPNCLPFQYNSIDQIPDVVNTFLEQVSSKVSSAKQFKHIGEAIKYHREQLGISQLELEVIIDKAPGHLSRIENDKITPEYATSMKIASALELTREEIVDMLAISKKPM